VEQANDELMCLGKLGSVGLPGCGHATWHWWHSTYRLSEHSSWRWVATSLHLPV